MPSLRPRLTGGQLLLLCYSAADLATFLCGPQRQSTPKCITLFQTQRCAKKTLPTNDQLLAVLLWFSCAATFCSTVTSDLCYVRIAKVFQQMTKTFISQIKTSQTIIID